MGFRNFSIEDKNNVIPKTISNVNDSKDFYIADADEDDVLNDMKNVSSPSTKNAKILDDNEDKAELNIG